jgi:hypothetical protein
MSVLKKLTEGVVERSLQREGAALLDKWERTGLLEGIDNDAGRQGMARLLENQASQLLKEASAMSTGDVEGFAAVAFPIVRRVFGGLLANDLVSVQPMSLPSGLIFFLDFSYSDQTTARLGLGQNESVYGGGVTGSSIQTGVTDITEEGGGFYNMANAYTSPTGSLALLADTSAATFAGITDNTFTTSLATSAWAGSEIQIDALNEAQKASLRYDADLIAGGGPNKLTTDDVVEVVVNVTQAEAAKMNFRNLGAFVLNNAHSDVDGTLRRLTHLGHKASNGVTVSDDDVKGANVAITFYVVGTGLTAANVESQAMSLSYPMVDAFGTGDALGSVRGASEWALEEAGASVTAPSGGASSDIKNEIPEIDIRVESIAVTAITKKLKAKWTPELGQDLNAYHNLDAEVELTQILSEHIALEIDREIVNDLVQGATAGTYYWSRSPGLFVNRITGAELGALSAAPDFTGTVSEWYETLVETINDVSAQIHRKTLRGGATFLVTSPEVANILEFTAGFRASVTADADKGTVGAVNVGNLSRKWDIYVDPYFPRNLVLVGRSGGSFLESGYVYAPYVPLQVTPTIFGTEDFVPRKGVMTRYAKKMVRPDMYGLVVVRGILGEAGATS